MAPQRTPEITKLSDAPLVRRVEASANTFVPALLMAFFLPCVINTIFPIDRYLQQLGYSAVWADRVATSLVFGSPVCWVLVEGICHGATHGMRKRKLVFRTADGEELSFGASAARVLVGVLFVPLLPISIAVALGDKRHRTLADLVCYTTMCLVPEEPDKSRCPHCGYLLCGLTEARCPECGKPFEPEWLARADDVAAGGQGALPERSVDGS